MPTVPTNTKCRELGCNSPKSTLSSYCLQHGGRDTYDHKTHNASPERKAFNGKYQSKRWKALRTIQLSSHPLCAACFSRGVIAPAQHVDHVFPWAQVGEASFYANIFQSLCSGCHTTKTHLEQRGIFRRYMGEGHTDYAIGDYTRILSNA